MSVLEELLKKHCPDGVEYKIFSDIAVYIRGVTYSKSKEINNNYEKEYWQILRANNIDLYSNTLNFDDIKKINKDVKINENQFLYANDIIICAGSGSKEHIGKVAFIYNDIPYSFGGFMGVIRANENILLPRYLFHILTSSIFKNHLNFNIYSTTINNLSSQIMNSFKIPVPPIEVQKEIVRILDEFTEKTTKLQELLHRETVLRKKQYEYYRDKLLTFGDEIEYVPLWSVTIWDKKFNSVDRKKQSEVINYPYLLASDLFAMEQNSGDVFLLSTGEKTGWTTEKIAGNNLCNGEVVTIPWGKSRAVIDCIKYYKGKFVTADNRIMTSKDKSKLNNKFLYYIVMSKGKLIDTFYRGSGIKHPDMSKVLDIIIPLPPLKEQERIVNILDKFDALCNDITKGLPAEIELRKKQYEYYRDKLLTFKEKKK